MSGNLSIFTRLITRTEVKHFSTMFRSVKKVCSVVASNVLQYLSRALARGCKQCSGKFSFSSMNF